MWIAKEYCVHIIFFNHEWWQNNFNLIWIQMVNKLFYSSPKLNRVIYTNENSFDIKLSINRTEACLVYIHTFGGSSARTRESSPSRATRAQGRRPSVVPSALPSSGRCALFFYCRPQPESQDVGESSSPPTPLGWGSPTSLHLIQFQLL
jgi:hypothetical protein